jgi:5-formyltetrahydrofolate cyclo-ligase
VGRARGESREQASRAKQAAREGALRRRDALPPGKRARLSLVVCERARQLHELTEADVLLLFSSFGSEIDTTPLIAWALGRGQVVALPRILGARTMAAFRLLRPDTDLVDGPWGIREPREGLETIAPQAIDTIVVPGVCFTGGGERCGYGGGFYDGYLRQTKPSAARVALAFEVQLVDDLPSEPHDLPVDVVVTERRVLRTGAR